MLLHPIYDRMITVRELARLYTYPDWFDFRPLSIDGMYRAITDSVPPKFSLRLAEALSVVLGGGHG
jgi:DNA (cytosine-5)-methyltransferase 1